MPIYINTLPNLLTQNKRVALPRMDEDRKTGYGNLVFLFSENIAQSIKMINNKENCYHDSVYYYYYNLLYKGVIRGRQYNIKNVKTRKDKYDRISKETNVLPHPPALLNKTPNRNCYFEMSQYIDIYKYMTQKYTPILRVDLFWSFFNSIWSGEQTSTYNNKYILIDADMYDKFKGGLRENIDNPIFILYYTMYKKFDSIKGLDIDFIIYAKRSVLRINPSQCNEKSYIIFRRELQKVFSKITNFADITDKQLDEDSQKETLKETLQSKYNFTGTNDNNEVVTNTSVKTTDKKDDVLVKLNDKIEKNIDNAKQEVSKIIPDEEQTKPEVTDFIQTKSEMELDNDKELIDDMYKLMQTQKIPTKPLSTARDARLREKQESIKLGSLSFKDLSKANSSKRLVPQRNVSNSIHSVNPNVKVKKFANINKDYIENVMPTDMAKTFASLNNKPTKFYVTNIKVEDSSNELNYKETWRVSLKDENGVPHSITVDVPKFLDNKFLYLGGNKKIIDRQNFLYPVVKTAPDTVQVVTNYNKMFIRRVGTKSISSVERIMKLISTNDDCYKYFEIGNASSSKANHITTIEYDEFAKVLTKFKSPKCEIIFNQSQAQAYASSKKIDIPANSIFVGMKDGKPLLFDVDTQLTPDRKTICDIIIEELPEDLQTEFSKTRSTKKLMYSSVTIMCQAIPFIVLLMYWEGITSVIKKLKIKYYFTPRYPAQTKPNENVIRFRDSYFVYESDLASALLMNGIKVLDTENHDMSEYNSNEPYVEYFKKVYGRTAIMNAIENYYDFMIDPITFEILEDIHLPTDLIELCIYANNLLADESYTIENSQTLSRVRSIEIIPGILYNHLSRAYLEYKNSAGKKKISIPKDCVIKDLLSLQTVEDYSTLNPVVELEKDRSITSKGFRGINVDRAYTEEKRSYDESMVGVMAMSTSPDGNCGINRFLTLEPTITSARGYVDIKSENKDDLKDVNIFSPTELLYPLGNTRDDSIRTAMAGKQSKHVIPVKNSIPALISNGVDESIKFDLSSDFVIIAEENGSVIDYDEKSKIMMIKYQSGKCRAIDLSPTIVKNGGGGFYLNNELVTKYKVGDKFKKDDTLAYHKEFFKDDKFNGVRMNVGTLEKVAITSSYDTYNDSTVITHKLARDAESNMTFCKSVVVGKNSNIYDIKKVGDHVSIGDPLLSFDVSFEDNELNKLLSTLSDENKETMEEGSMNTIKSKYAGRIIDIKIYSTVDIPELSESLQKIVKSYYATVNNRKKFVSKYDPDSNSIVKCGLLLNETTGKVEPNIYGVIKGQQVEDSILIEFYIEHGDIMGVGDKLA